MFSLKEKQHIAAEIEKLLLALNHPEMPDKQPNFTLHVYGKEGWSWADIVPNWIFTQSNLAVTTEWNEKARDILKENQP